MIRNLRIRFVIFSMTIVTVILAVMMVMVYRFNCQALEIQSLSVMRRLSSEVPDPPVPGERPEDAMMIFFTLGQRGDNVTVVQDSDQYDLTDQDRLRGLMDAARQTGEDSGVLEEYGLRFLRDREPGKYHFADSTTELQIRSNLRNVCLVVGAISFLIFLLMSGLLSRWVVRPVERAWEQQRRFLADASHELKTPLAVIMSNAELLEGESPDVPYAGNILSVSYQMRTLVERMLEMARVDSVKLARVPQDLSQLVSDAALSVQLLYEERGRPLRSDIQEGLRILGSESHIYQLMDVLLDNALKYSRGEGPVEVTLKAQGRFALLTVTSPGTPLTAKERRDIFKRFYRLDQARSMDGSYGLGLSIAQGIAEAHRGKIWAASSGQTNSFHVLLPTCQKKLTEN